MDISAVNTSKLTTSITGLQYEDTVVGMGATSKKGDTVEVHYTGWIYKNGQKGAQFDSSLPRDETFSFKIGSHMVIQGWEEGLVGMQVGGKRTLIIPPSLGYGPRGSGRTIPPDSTLIFEVDLIKIN
ncbi:MAG: FKBP-type peptidyl-prolyl cis-trans isomerase [Chlamydiae bacterium]|nr:FKBP-type peptidyl-prolyl cis-trans isomerase [Chlamydiota bacterium]